MATIFPYRGKLYARVYLNGRWIKRALKATDKRLAKREADAVEAELLDPANAAAHQTSLVEGIEAFIASRHRKGSSAGTLHMYGIKCGHLIRVFGATRPLILIDASAVDGYIDTRLEEGAKRTTIGKELTALRGTLKIALRSGKWKGNIAAVMPNEFAIEYEPRKRALADIVHARALFEYLASPRSVSGRRRNALNQAACAAFMLASGARLGETLRAEVGDIDLERGRIFLRVTKTKKSGKGDRYVPITRLTRTLCIEIVKATEGRQGRLFDAWTNVQRDIADACKAIGIPRLSPNDLRRTHSTWLVNRAIPAQLVSEILGHMDTRMVERVYGRLTPEALQSNVTKLLAAAPGMAGDDDGDTIEAAHTRACRNVEAAHAEIVRLFGRVQELAKALADERAKRSTRSRKGDKT